MIKNDFKNISKIFNLNLRTDMMIEFFYKIIELTIRNIFKDNSTHS